MKPPYWVSQVEQYGCTRTCICIAPGINGFKTNHSLRVTATTCLYQAGVSGQIIMETTGRKSTDGDRSYKHTALSGESLFLTFSPVIMCMLALGKSREGAYTWDPVWQPLPIVECHVDMRSQYFLWLFGGQNMRKTIKQGIILWHKQLYRLFVVATVFTWIMVCNVCILPIRGSMVLWELKGK